MLPNALQCVKTPHTHYKQRIVKFQMPVVLRLRSISDGGETLSILDGHIFNTDALVLAKRHASEWSLKGLQSWKIKNISFYQSYILSSYSRDQLYW